ncbi:MAG: NAD(P)-binding domain-containing protein, partial [Gemmatimonadetes bacterium]|nr:NAD(P)-binding domain-containing protein [Gemmatimonadota bacterium]
PADCEIVDCHRIVLATGYFDHPRLAGLPGEDLPHVSHYFDEGHLGYDRDVVIVGGGNSAVEAALDLYRCGARVTMIHRGESIKPTVKYWIKPDLENRIAEGSLTARFRSTVERIDPQHVVLRRRKDDGGEVMEEIPADRVYLLTGFQPDFGLFRELGVELEGENLVPRLDPETLESNVPGLYVVGSITRGRKVSDIFIENGRFDGEKVFG